MRFTIATILALASSVLAQEATTGFNPLTKPTKNEIIPAGQDYTIEWTPAGQAGPVSLVLFAGASHSLLQESGPIGAGIDAKLGKYRWSVASTLGKDKAYGIKIILDSDKTVFQWSNPFTIQAAAGGSDNGTTSSTSSSAETSTSASATASSTSKTATLTSSPSAWPTVGPSGNLSTTTIPPKTTLTPTTTGGSSSGSTTSASTTIPSAGASALGVGSMAVLGGFAMAVLAM